MHDITTMIFVTFIASVGFSFMFHMPARLIAISSLGAVLTWGLYEFLFTQYAGDLFLPCFIASVFAGLWAYFLERVFKAPLSMFFMIAVVPLIPGSSLYYTIFNISQSNMQQAGAYGTKTATLALAIAFGISLIWSLLEIVRRYRRHYANKLTQTKNQL